MSLSPHGDLHEQAQEDLPSLVLGEAADPDVAAHVAGCAACQADLGAYRRVVDVARVGGRMQATDDEVDDVPPPGVWDRIRAETGIRDSTPPAPAADPPAPVVPLRPRPRARWRRPLLAVAAVLVLGVGAGAAGWAIGSSGRSASVPQVSLAALQAMPGTSDDVRGTATVRPSAAGLSLDVVTHSLPADDGYYEVWLYNPSIDQMVAVGTLGTGGRGTFTVPGGIDLSAYHVVDVSAQRYDGSPAHERSVLRGPLSR